MMTMTRRTFAHATTFATVLLVRHALAQTPVERDACRVESGGGVTGASADICEQLARRWLLLFGFPALPGVIRLVDREGNAGAIKPSTWQLESPLPKGASGSSDASRRRKNDGLLTYYANDIIPHEAGHEMFGLYIRDLNVGSAAYGSAAPDWFDEAPAIWMESQALRARRMRNVQNTTPSLTALVTMTHPNEELVRDDALGTRFRPTTRTVTSPCPKCTWLPDSLRKKYQVIDVGTNARGRPDTVLWYSDHSPNPDGTLEQREFYPLAYSLLRFVRMNGGAIAVRDLTNRYRDNPRAGAQALSGLPGLPSTVEAVEQAWHEFLKHPPPEDR